MIKLFITRKKCLKTLGDVFENDITTMATIGDDAESFSSIDDQKPPGKFLNSF
jgi:hypothetical protein